MTNLKNLECLLYIILLTPFVAAFSQDTEDDENIYDLNPFEIDASKDTGYYSENSLAGSRLNTSLRDTPASIQVYTREFIDDIGATNLEDILNYSANASDGSGDEEAFFGGHFAVRGFVSFQPRVRGLPSTRARDYFRSEMPFDTYNIERIDESRGPNSLLFGVAKAGGIQNQTTKKASVADNFGKVTFRTDNDGLIRGEADYNQVLIEDKLAFRLNALHADGDGWRLNNFNRKNAIHGALTWRPDDKTVIRLGYESFSQTDIPSNVFVGLDDLRFWIDAGKPTFDLFSDNRISIAGANGAVSGANRNQIIRAEGATTVNKRLRVAFIEGGDPSFEGTLVNLSRSMTTVPFLDRGDGNYTTQWRLARDESEYPYDVAMDGPSNIRRLHTADFAASLERQLAEDLYVQLDYNRWSYYWAAAPNNIWVQMRGDPNEFFVGHDATPATAVANPNAGGTLAWSPGGIASGRQDTDRDQETLRVTSIYELDFAERSDGALSKLGRHRLAGGLERRIYNSFQPNRRLMWRDAATNLPAYDLSQPGGVLNRAASHSYIDFNDRSTWKGADLSPLGVDGTLNGVSERFTDPTDPSRQVYAAYSFDSANLYHGDQEIDTLMASTQSFFFDEKLVITAGYREDEGNNKRWLYEKNSNNTDYVLSGDYEPTNYKLSNFTAGAVFHIDDQFSVFYNQATNFDIPSPENRIIGSLTDTPIGQMGWPGEGKGQDYGVMADFFDDRINIRATRYTSTQGNAFKSGSALDSWLHDPTIMWWDDIGFGLPDDPPGPRRFQDYVNRMVYAAESNGYEFQMVANLTDNWRAILNYSYTYKMQKDVGILENQWLNETLEWMKRTIQTWDTSTMTQAWEDAGIIQTNDINEFELSDGRTGAEIIERMTDWQADNLEPGNPIGIRRNKFNFFTNYTFTEGPLQGYSIGGGYRHQSPNALHWADDSSGNRTRFWGESTGYADAMIRYRTRMHIWGKDVMASYQINVQNLLDDHDPIIGRHWRNDSTKPADRLYFVQPRNVQVTATFSF